MPKEKRTRLRREIAVILTVKFVVLMGLFFAFFSPSHRLHPDSSVAAAHLLGSDNR